MPTFCFCQSHVPTKVGGGELPIFHVVSNHIIIWRVSKIRVYYRRSRMRLMESTTFCNSVATCSRAVHGNILEVNKVCLHRKSSNRSLHLPKHVPVSAVSNAQGHIIHIVEYEHQMWTIRPEQENWEKTLRDPAQDTKHLSLLADSTSR